MHHCNYTDNNALIQKFKHYVMITMHWYRNLDRLCFQKFRYQTKQVWLLFKR